LCQYRTTHWPQRMIAKTSSKPFCSPQCPEARENANPRYHGLHQLRHLYLRLQVFQPVHDLSHPGTKTTAKLVAQRFVWPGVPHLATCLPVLPALQTTPLHSHSIG
jgi:hypothetical protein